MHRYVWKRILIMIPVLLGVTVLIFTIMYFTPGDAAETLLGSSATDAQLAAKREQLGIDKPYIVQLTTYMKNLFFHGDMGKSYSTSTSISAELMQRFPRTLALAFVIMLMRAILGTSLGVVAALHQDKFLDKFCMVLALIGASMPAFWLALMLVIVFSLRLGWFPPYGVGGIEYYILPCIAASISSIGQQARQSRSAVLECIRADYVTTARAKGLSERRILFRHILSNAMIPIITVIGTGFGFSLAGTLIIENVFGIPGIGLYMNNGIFNRDYPVVTGSVILVCFMMSIVMLIMDLIYAFLDPRIKAQYENQSARRIRIKRGNDTKKRLFGREKTP